MTCLAIKYRVGIKYHGISFRIQNMYQHLPIFNIGTGFCAIAHNFFQLNDVPVRAYDPDYL
jgi:hypothetical protein